MPRWSRRASILAALTVALPLSLCSGVAAAAPPKPGGVYCTPTGTGQIDVATYDVDNETSTDVRDTLSGRTWTFSYDEVGYPYDARLTGLNADQQYSLEIRYTDASGTSAWSKPCPAIYARPAHGNLVLNPSADLALAYWHGLNGTVSVTTGGSPGFGGAKSFRVTRASGTSYGLTDYAAGALPTVVRAAARPYVAAAWVQAGSASAVGKPATISLQERDASGNPVRVTSSAGTKLTTKWQQVWVQTPAARAGDTLSVSVEQAGATRGNVLKVDDIRVHPKGFVVSIDNPQQARPVDPDITRATAVDMMPCSPNDPLPLNCDEEYDLTTYSAYIDGQAGGSGSASIRGVIYADTGDGPGQLVATTKTVTVKAGRAAGWVNLPLAAPVEVDSTIYWFGYQVGGAKHVVRFYGDDETYYCDCPYAIGIWSSDTFADGPNNPFGDSHDANLNTMVRGLGGY